jgi:signal transduction histidine kinase
VSPIRLTLAAAAAGAAATAAITTLPFLHFAYRSPSAHVALETAAVLIASMTGFLVAGRYRRTARLDDLLLALALALFAAANLVFGAIPRVGDLGEDAMGTWAPLAARLLATATFAAAAFAPPVRVRRTARAARLAAAAGVGLLVAVGAAVALLGSRLPRALDTGLSPESSNRPFFVGSTGLLAAQFLGVILLGAAAVGFTRKAGAGDDPLLRLLGPAAAIRAFASVNYFLFPSIYSEWLYTGDAFRLAFYLVLLTAAGREVHSYWHRLADLAAQEERRRIARDLHDGAAQDMAFVVTQARRARTAPTPDALAALVGAAERGLDESRRAIDALSQRPDEPLDVTIARAAELVATRAGARVELDLDEGVDVAPAVREELIRIVREAVTNAVRHGGASTVHVALSGARDGLRLAVADEGSGFGAGEARAGFGLTSMRERAARIGGRCLVTSALGRGTTVEVLVP